jgi:hypothetical protein
MAGIKRFPGVFWLDIVNNIARGNCLEFAMPESSLGALFSPAAGTPRRKHRRVWRVRLWPSWLVWIGFAYRPRHVADDVRNELRGLPPDALRDIGVPPEMLNELEALQEFERKRWLDLSQFW